MTEEHVRLQRQASNLRDATARLASPSAAQIEYLRALGVAPLADELALEFDDQYQPIALLREHETISADAEQALSAVDGKLRAMSQHKNLWTEDA